MQDTKSQETVANNERSLVELYRENQSLKRQVEKLDTFLKFFSADPRVAAHLQKYYGDQ